MMKRNFLLFDFFLIAFSVATIHCSAQTSKDISNGDSLFYGTWKGSSVCQVKNSACHDENVVYYISRLTKDAMLEVKASKIVEGKEVEMGTIQFHYDSNTKQITSVSLPNAIWNLQRKQNTIEGTLYNNKVLYRIIKVSKE